MSIPLLIATAIVVILVIGAILVNLRAVRAARALPRLDAVAPDLEQWPVVSLVVAACNEADTIRAATRTLLEMDYPRLELIIVDDRSTDGTSEIVDQLAAEDARVRVVHIRELPDGWLGKLYAMHRATETSSGDFIVYTDADVHFAPDMLRRAVTLCERDGIGHLAVMPKTRGGTLATDAAIASFATGLLNTFNVHDIGREGSTEVVGVGAFGMVRRSDFERTPGWTWLKMEVLDDLGLAMMMVQKAGAKPCLVNGVGLLSLTWYADLPSLVRGLEKNGFVGLADFSFARVAQVVTSLPLVVGAVAASYFFPIAWVQALGALHAASLCLLAYTFQTTVRHPPLATILGFFTLPILSWAVLRSTIKTVQQRGIYWRGTFYALDDLRAGKRAHL